MKVLHVTLALSFIFTQLCYSMAPTALHLQLFNAAKDGNVNQAQAALHNGANSNDQDNDQRTPLHYAAAYGHTELVKLLLNSGAKVNVQTRTGTTPLHEAALKGYIKIVELLINAGAYINAYTNRDRGSRTPLHWAAMQGHSETAHYLLNAGADQNARDANYHTPFHWAVMGGHTAVVKVFIDAHVNVNTQDKYKWTPLDWAIRDGYSVIAKLLLNAGAHINTHYSHDYNPLTLAINDGHNQIVKFIQNYIKLLKYTPSKQLLSQAIQFCYVHLVKLLLQAGIKPDIHDLTLVKLKYNQEPEKWHKDNYKAIGRMILQHLRLSGTLQTPKPYNMTNLLSAKNAYGPIAKSGLGLPEDIVHTIASFSY